ncbi:MAG: ParA family protein [Chromatiales bacterium]|nr:ParA family protein [Chromatiales bacterium]
MKILASYNIKGGVGKTATAVNLAWLASREGYRTVIWDLDPQGAASFYFRIRPKVKGGAKGLLTGDRPLDEAVRATDYMGLDLIPADFSYRNLDVALQDARKPAKQLLRLMKPLADEYDFLILDASPNISLVSENIFNAADALLLPLIPTTLSVRTYRQLLSFFEKHPQKRLLLLPFFSMVDRRRGMHRELMDELPRKYPEILSTAIPYASQVEAMGSRRQPVGVFSSANHPIVQAYRSLWNEILNKL